MIENREVRVRINVGGSSKNICLLTPEGLDLNTTVKTFKKIIKRDMAVQQHIVGLDEDCGVEILAIDGKIVGISIPDNCDDKT